MLDNKKTFFVLLAAICFLPGIAMGGKLEPLRDLPAPRSNPMTSEKIELGKKLYFDRRLSGDRAWGIRLR